VLEVGLGGRLDATNVVERPAATAITRIAMDHMDFLGDTIETIAFEKAGIIKPRRALRHRQAGSGGARRDRRPRARTRRTIACP
jgi:folylpolyglutamate synthase/dihydropteroate synthase